MGVSTAEGGSRMTELTRKQAVTLAMLALQREQPVKWIFKTNPLRLVSPVIHATSQVSYRVVIHTNSRWWPRVTIESLLVKGSFRVWWPGNPLAGVLRIRLVDWYEKELLQRQRLVSTLERLQDRKRLRE